MAIFGYIFAFLTSIIFWLFGQLLQLIDNLSKYQFFSDGVIGDFTNKVYVILGVLMLFKLVISAIQYLVNPDVFDDKSKGAVALLKRTVVAVGLLVLVPTIFDFGIHLQKIIVRELPKIVFNNNQSVNVELPKVNGTDNIDFENAGVQISNSIVKGFLVQNGNNTATPGVSIENVKNPMEYTGVLIDKCAAGFDIGAWLSGSKCAYNIIWWLLLPIGIYFVFLLLALVKDIGIRTIKIGIIRILAPVPIANYITDEKKLGDWAKTSLQVYSDLFIRMFIIYFVVYIILAFLSSTVGTTGYEGLAKDIGRPPSLWESIFVKVAVIIALLLFAQNAPKFICDLLGIKGVDESIGNMFKRATGMLGATTAFAGRYTATRRNARNKALKDAGIDVKSDEWKNKSGEERRKALKEALKGKHVKGKAFRAASAGFTRGMYESFAHDKGFKDARSAARHSADKSYAISQELETKGVTRHQFNKAIRAQNRGIESTFAASNLEIEAGKAMSDAAKAGLDFSHSNTMKFADVRFDEEGLRVAKKKITAPIFIGYDARGHAINVSVDDMSQEFLRDPVSHQIQYDADGNPITTRKGAYSISGVIKGLQNILADTSDKYTAQQKADAEGELDKLQGIFDTFIANNAHNSDIVGKENPRYINILQDALDNFNKYARNTDFGRRMVEEGINLGMIDPTTKQPYEARLGDFLTMMKNEGQRTQGSTKAGMGTREMAEMAADELAKKFNNKSGS